MYLQPVFINIIGIEYLEQNNEQLEKFCREKIEEEKNRVELTQSLFFDLNHADVKSLVDNVETLLDSMYLSLGMNSKYKLEIFRGWSNLNAPAPIVSPHYHPESFFSAVYYVKANKSDAPLTFISPISQIQFNIRPEYISTSNEFNASLWQIPPETGKLLLFPSWLMHYVKDINSNDRISISFDTKLNERTKSF
jgi:uncharacterized protein (TIGR02466 family)